jgi:hypothetical protein
MKRILFSIALAASTFAANAQENVVIISGGYAFITGDEIFADLTGWRINGVYEYNPMGGAISHGLAFGYAATSGPSTLVAEAGKTVNVNTFPLYYQPKFMMGNDKIKGFIKGALGWQWTNFERPAVVGTGTLSGNDSGFMGGGGAGFMFNIKPNIFIQAEYEITWMSNYYINDGWLNSAMGGIGFRF